MKLHRYPLFVAVMLTAMLFLLMITSADAYTLCGAPAVGKRYLEGDTWPQSGPARGAPGQYVDDDGYWKYCPTWVEPNGGDPKTPEPQPACGGRDGYERWNGADGRSQCDSGPRVGIDSTHIRLGYTIHGGKQMIYDDEGQTRGAQQWQCRAGVWLLLWESCETIKQAPAPKSFGAPRLVVKPRVP